ncbi:LysM peptidoglycan-binding domain-containing protein [Paenibacillus sp. MWE-103]|uniref:LysM peptidoglycan-binding domain-containing protein n=1 Tax=Paenibacillus artemisiicola TaxID=1172618 RepID=A0ABS3W5J6_9BACL|nr:LysM peptidoglycan-binding domain-containing protein [Paenibacillus artemisiicola]MBO7743573.1 LysM peptidoglycan-binding domain-containing protein [Paenibacillus artemisiicola]
MALEKALIQPLDEQGGHRGQPVRVLFNPSEYSIEKGNQYQSVSIPGLSVPATQFVSGNARTLTMDLFFDSYERGEDVRAYTSQVTDLLDIDGLLRAPPVCAFIWGKLEFKGVIEKVSQKFTMFVDSGIPVRATLNVSFKEYKTIQEQLSPSTATGQTRQVTANAGTSLSAIAQQQYGDPGRWREIAQANNIANPRRLTPGQPITVPPLE